MEMNSKLQLLTEKRKKYGNIGAIDFLIELEKKKLGVKGEAPTISYTPFLCKPVSVPQDLEKFKAKPAVLPKDFCLPPIKGAGNDYSHLLADLDHKAEPNISVVVLNYNRCHNLENTLAGIVNQNYNQEKIEVIVTDDGSSRDTMAVVKKYQGSLNIKYVWHPDIGFTPAIARNNGVKLAKNDFIILLDVDMYPSKNLFRTYAKYSEILKKIVLIGPRKYKDLNGIDIAEIRRNPDYVENLPDVMTNNDVAGRISGDVSVDWRLDTFVKSEGLKHEKLPFRMFAAGNVAFSRQNYLDIGGFDERFRDWGFEDGELAFRFFNNGLYMVADTDAWAFHQEPVNGVNETDRSSGKSVTGPLYGTLCPYYRKLAVESDVYEVPTVSIYIPAYNAEKTILDAVESALNQTFKDLEVCICDDGSSDGTVKLLEKYYSNNPRVRWISQKNKGIGGASNTALELCKGIYIGQLDSDDILASDVVEKCVPYFEKDMKIGLVYTTYENENIDGSITPGYNYPVYTREKLTTAMIAHHFRMFRRRDWARVRFNERIKNAVDYDFYLRLSEVCQAQHINMIGYRRRLHGNNTSLKDNTIQNINAAKAVNESLQRQGVPPICYLEDDTSPKLSFKVLDGE